jgi:hypothetical protein
MASRRGYLRTVAGVALAGGGCVARETGRTSVHIQVSAAPDSFAQFSTCRLVVDGISVEPYEGSYETYDISPATVDPATGGGPWLIANVDLPPDDYVRLRFEVERVEATLSNGDSAPITVPGQDTFTVMEPFRVRAHVGTTLTAILTVIEAEATDRYGLRAVPDLLRVNYTDGPRTHPLTAIGGSSE